MPMMVRASWGAIGQTPDFRVGKCLTHATGDT